MENNKTIITEMEKFHDKPMNKKSDIEIDKKVTDLISKMTIKEKIGQMYQMVKGSNPFGAVICNRDFDDSIKAGLVGVILGMVDPEEIYKYQKLAVTETRLGIPLLFNADVIHGFDTIYPIPLAFACSFDMNSIEMASRVAATEATMAGVHWNNAPMLDISRDPRWGRCTEGVGEDPYLASLIAKAQVDGFQTGKPGEGHYMMACAKHYIGYGTAVGGRDYNTVDMSERELREVYLPPFKAAIDAGIDSIMPAFNLWDATPCTSNEFLLKTLAREEMGFKGIFLSDYGAVGELINHGCAKNQTEASKLCINATLDIEMVSDCYTNTLETLIDNKEINESQIDESVRRILTMKYKMGLFDNPYSYIDPVMLEKISLNEEHREIARDLSKKSIVLLKNEEVEGSKILPLSKRLKNIALIGPFADEKEVEGAWAFVRNRDSFVTLEDGIRNLVGDSCQITKVKGCQIDVQGQEGFQEAITAAKEAEVVILALGESKDMTGEARSYGKLDLPGEQNELAKEIMKIGKPTVLVLFNGRPLPLVWYDENVPAILETWFLGTEAGNAIADVLFGDYNPSGKLAMSIPYCEGQIPVYYNHHRTGRPYEENTKDTFRSKYMDIPNDPLYPFGHGLSYTTFEYSDISLSNTVMVQGETIEASIYIENTGQYPGHEVVQLYIRDLAAYGISRPVKELKGFEKIFLNPGERKEVTFTIHEDLLKFYDKNMNYIIEEGDFNIFIGTSSKITKEVLFQYKA
ncbi:beta-glucosidase BglX [Clostridium sediminicola]|uniref:beta-glucosidase BglX n=1 Tax=Clostridium sediminicola TaxID=3114879 RepID=UPI0031F207CE